jgi:uncharacterized protein (DUF1800 family)
MAETNLPLMAAIATSRFGLGARPGEIDKATSDPKGWLKDQVRRSSTDLPTPRPESTETRLRQVFENRANAREERQNTPDTGPKPPKLDREARQARRKAQGADRPGRRQMQGEMAGSTVSAGEPSREFPLREKTAEDFLARTRLAVQTTAPFRERWTLFWANHFTVAATKALTVPIVGPFEVEAIRPHVFGRFEDMLLAVSQHPGMLLFLDQVRSVGPNAQAGREGRGLNENLSREILELHTLGVDGGYQQADVTEFAKALTGWSIANEANPQHAGQFLFRDGAHEPGERLVVGQRYRAGGEVQGREILRDLAAHPSTARHLSRKIAIHFVSDDPPPALVARLEQAYLSSHGQLDAMAMALIDAPEAWDIQARKIKPPYDFVVSAWRALDHAPERVDAVAPILTSLGQKPFSAGSPKGWADDGPTWSAPDALLKRMAWAEQIADQHARNLDPMQFARQALGARLGQRSAQAIARSESRAEGLTLALMSPEFLRR